jgi:hypothetical protein
VGQTLKRHEFYATPKVTPRHASGKNDRDLFQGDRLASRVVVECKIKVNHKEQTP